MNDENAIKACADSVSPRDVGLIVKIEQFYSVMINEITVIGSIHRDSYDDLALTCIAAVPRPTS